MFTLYRTLTAACLILALVVASGIAAGGSHGALAQNEDFSDVTTWPEVAPTSQDEISALVAQAQIAAPASASALEQAITQIAAPGGVLQFDIADVPTRFAFDASTTEGVGLRVTVSIEANPALDGATIEQ